MFRKKSITKELQDKVIKSILAIIKDEEHKIAYLPIAHYYRIQTSDVTFIVKRRGLSKKVYEYNQSIKIV